MPSMKLVSLTPKLLQTGLQHDMRTYMYSEPALSTDVQCRTDQHRVPVFQT